MKFSAQKPTTLLELIQNGSGCSTTKAKKMVKNSDVLIDGVLTSHPNPSLTKGTVVLIKPKKSGAKADFKIIYEDKDLIVVDKPSGIVTSGANSDVGQISLHNKISTYLHAQSHGKDRAYVVHRLDKKVSGVLIFAKSEKICHLIVANWPSFEKRYHAVVEGEPTERQATLKSWLKQDSGFKVYSTHEAKDAKLAITHYQVLKTVMGLTLLDIKIETGRKNQIRVQLAEIGCPIVGDEKYGAKKNPFKRIGLHAYTLSIVHPITCEKMVFNSPTPHLFFLNKK